MGAVKRMLDEGYTRSQVQSMLDYEEETDAGWVDVGMFESHDAAVGACQEAANATGEAKVIPSQSGDDNGWIVLARVN